MNNIDNAAFLIGLYLLMYVRTHEEGCMNECISEIVYYTFKIFRKSFEWAIAFYLLKDEPTFHSMKVKYSL